MPIWRWLRMRLSDRDDTEHEQILIRIALGFLAFVYVVSSISNIGAGEAHAWLGLGIVSGHFFGALILFTHLVTSPAKNVARRCVGMVLDITALTLILLWGEKGTALFYPLYLWVTLGMGFRYGRSYLFASAALTALGFAAVIALAPSWQGHLPLTLSLWAALLFLPAYASSLLSKLTHALNRAEEANRTKGRFLATMSHELRTPLHAIIGMSELLEAKSLDPEQRQMVGIVRNAGHTLLKMIEDVLDVARIESERIAKDTSDFDLHAALNTVRNLLYHQAKTKGIDLHFEIDPHLPYRLHGVSPWLKQILINLLGNAIKFTDRGRVVLRVGSEAVDAGQVQLRIEVEDTGIGIPPHLLARIFDQFVQADESTTRPYGGTGLGLAIARQFADRMGGRLTVTSEEGKGSCFTFTAPFALAADEAETRALDGRVVIVGRADGSYGRHLTGWGADPILAEGWEEATRVLSGDVPIGAVLLISATLDEGGHHEPFFAKLSDYPWPEPIDVINIGAASLPDAWPVLVNLPEDHHADALYRAVHAALASPATVREQPAFDAEPIPFRHRRILVAEDNRINQRVIEKMLSIGGHTVTIVDNGEQLLDMLDDDEHGFDLILADLNMPVMNGLDALKMHRIAIGTDHPPFVALTADATERSREECLEAGMAGYVTKPVDLRDLLILIDRLTAPKTAVGHERSAGSNVVRHPRFAASRQVLDQTHIERLRDLDQDDNFLSEVIVDFIEDASMLVDELEAAARSGDSVAFRDRAHALRSSAAHLGATGIYDLCLVWRDFTPEDLQARGEAEIKLLKSEFNRLRDALALLVDEAKQADVDRRL